MQKKWKHFRGVIGGRRCVGARAICNAFTTWILVGLSRVMTFFRTLFEFISEERFLQSPDTFWVSIFHVLAWVKVGVQLINQSRFLLEIRYWILSSNKSFILNAPLVSCPISVFCFDLFMSCTHPKWMNGIGQMTKGAFRINHLLWNPYFRWSTMESQHFENLLLYHQVWTQKETCYCVEIIKIPWLPSNLYL